MMTYRAIDLNIFYREEWDENTQQSYYTPTLFIDVYDYWHYISSEYGLSSDHAELGVLIECSIEETQAMRRAYPENEYGMDWWIQYPEAVLPATLHEKLKNKLRTITIPVVR